MSLLIVLNTAFIGVVLFPERVQFGRHTTVAVKDYIREFKQIATASADTAGGSKFSPKCDTARALRLHSAVARNLTT